MAVSHGLVTGTWFDQGSSPSCEAQWEQAGYMSSWEPSSVAAQNQPCLGADSTKNGTPESEEMAEIGKG